MQEDNSFYWEKFEKCLILWLLKILRAKLHRIFIFSFKIKFFLSSGGLKHAPVIINKHYDDLPRMSTEIGLFLIFTKLIGKFLTKKLQPYLSKVESNERGFIYKYGKYWFQTANSGLLYHKAKISVRFLAHAGLWIWSSDKKRQKS